MSLTSPGSLKEQLSREDNALRRRIWVVTLIPALSGIAVVAILFLSIRTLVGTRDDLRLQQLKLKIQVEQARETETDLLKTLGALLSSSDIHVFDRDSVDWKLVTSSLVDGPGGRPKTIALNALLLSWKQIEFNSGGTTVAGGFDSPRFVADVLRRSGVAVPEEVVGQQYGPRLLSALRKRAKAEVPQPGDLIVYQYTEGDGLYHTVAFVYLAPGKDTGNGIGVGMPNSRQVRLLDTSCLTRRTCGWAGPFLGYYTTAPRSQGMT